MADEKKYIEEPIERKSQTDAGAGTATLIEEPIERAAAAAPVASERPAKLGFTAPNLLSAAKEGIVGLGRGAVSLGHDVLTNPDWLVGQGRTIAERLGDPNTTFNRFFAGPAIEEHKKAADIIRQLPPGRAPWEQLVQAGGHELASLLPIIGPAAASRGEQAGRGDVGGALAGGGVQLLAGAAAPKVLGKVAEEAGALPRIWRGLKTIGEGETPPAPRPPAAPEIRPVSPAPASRLVVPEHYPGPRSVTRLSEIPPAEVKPVGEPESEYEIRTRTTQPTKHIETIAKEEKARSAEEAEQKRADWERRGSQRLPTLYEKEVRPIPLTVENVVNQAMGVRPLEPKTPLREQAAKPGEVVDPLKAKYPDPAVRQMVRANGEQIYEAAKGNPNLMKDLHDLTRVDLRQALINAGEDMGQTTVSDSKFAGKGSISRQDAFNRLLGRGVKPADIVKLAKEKVGTRE